MVRHDEPGEAIMHSSIASVSPARSEPMAIFCQ